MAAALGTFARSCRRWRDDRDRRARGGSCSPSSRGVGRLDELELPRRGCGMPSESLDRSTQWPYDERGEVGAFSYQRFSSPTVAAAEAELGALDGGAALALPVGRRGDDGARPHAFSSPATRSRSRRAPTTGRARRSRRSAAGGCASSSSTRPDRRPRTPTSSGSRRRRIRSSRCPTSKPPPRTRRGSSSMRPRRRRSTCGRSSTEPTSSSTARRSTSPAQRRRSSASSSAATPRRRRNCRSSAALTGIVAAPDPAWLLLRGLKTLQPRVSRQSEKRRASRRPAPRPLERADRPLSRLRRSSLLRRRRRAGRAPGRDLHARHRERNIARRCHESSKAGRAGRAIASRPGLLRLSVGVEDREELWADLDQALGSQ